MTEEAALVALKAAYAVEVEQRGGTVISAEGLERISKWLANSNRKPFLILMGKVGNGKTTAALAISNLLAYLDTRKVNYDDRVKVKYCSAKDVAEYSAKESKEDTRYSSMKDDRTDLLIIDDLGTEPAEIKSYGNIISPVMDVIYTRYNDMLPTIITTNLTPPEITERYGERIGDRLREVAEKVSFKGESYRR